jgi:hypothetical protein
MSKKTKETVNLFLWLALIVLVQVCAGLENYYQAYYAHKDAHRLEPRRDTISLKKTNDKHVDVFIK